MYAFRSIKQQSEVLALTLQLYLGHDLNAEILKIFDFFRISSTLEKSQKSHLSAVRKGFLIFRGLHIHLYVF